jgi:hypothetical protein
MRTMDTPQRHRGVAPLCPPGLVADRLRTLCDNALILLTDTNQVVTIEVSVVTPCPHVLVDISGTRRVGQRDERAPRPSSDPSFHSLLPESCWQF